jgi:hypothetical protein
LSGSVVVVVDEARETPWAGRLRARLEAEETAEAVALGRSWEDRRFGWLLERYLAAQGRRSGVFGGLETGQPVPGRETGARPAEELGVWLAAGSPEVWPGESLALRFGDEPDLIPYWTEAFHRRPVGALRVLWRASPSSPPRAVRHAEISIPAGVFPADSVDVSQAGEALLLSAIREWKSDPPRTRERWAREPEQPDFRDPRIPGPAEMMRFVAPKVAASLAARWRSRGRRPQWFVALRPNQGANAWEPGGAAFRPVDPPAGMGEMADPFLAADAGRQYLFFEEIPPGASRGRLCVAELDERGQCREAAPVLERAYHLSYPLIIRRGEEMFMLPESSEAGKVVLYRFRRFPWEVDAVAELVGEPLVDTTPVEVEGVWYFFTAAATHPEGRLYYSDRLEGPWTPHPASPVSRTVVRARPGGACFWRRGRLYRVVQDCGERYGRAIEIREVTELTKERFSDRPVGRIEPAWRPDLLGTHTLNENEAFQVLDGLRYR